MTNKKNYNTVNALIYELIIFLCRFYPLKQKAWIRKILDYCRPDWAAFRAEVAMQEVDKQVEELHAQWDAEEKEKQKPVYTELPPDGSKAQDLLGGEMRLSAPWTVETSYKTEPSSSHERN
jgi:hypothetical protein